MGGALVSGRGKGQAWSWWAGLVQWAGLVVGAGTGCKLVMRWEWVPVLGLGSECIALGVLGVQGTGCQVVWVCGSLGVLGVQSTRCAECQVCQVLRVLGTECVWLPGVPGSTCARRWVASVPHRVSIVSEAGQGTLTIRDVKEADQGAYTCEAINTLGMVFGIPDSILTVTRPGEQSLPPTCHQSHRGTVTITSCVISHRAMS